MKIRIGTRRSRLAMWQTKLVATLLLKQNSNIEIEYVPIKTLGDRDKITAIASLDATGVFTKDIENALIDERCDIAVHSFKDLATVMPKKLIIGAVLKREDPWDVLVSRRGEHLLELPPGSIVGTSSPRRRSLLLATRPDLKVANLRGNVPTRLRAVGVDITEGNAPKGTPFDAIILAFAGLKRLGFERFITEVLSSDSFLPAPAQGSIAIQLRKKDIEIINLLQPFNHTKTRLTTTAERCFLNTMEGGCHMPLGALAKIQSDGVISLAGTILNLDGTKMIKGAVFGNDPIEVGTRLANDMFKNGGDEILKELATVANEINNETPKS